MRIQTMKFSGMYRRLAGRCGVLALIVLLASGCATQTAIDRFYHGYDAELPLDAVHRSTEERPGYQREEWMITGTADHRVPVLLARPLDARSDSGPYPVVVFLHGIGQRKEFLDEIAWNFVEAGFAIATFDQYTRGERRLPRRSPVGSAWALRRRTALTPVETQRLVDFLAGRPDIDAERIYLLGASYGAMTGTVAAARDERLRAVILAYGGGHIPSLLRSPELKRAAPSLVYWLAEYPVTWFFAPADPVRHIGHISPRPILFQNGLHDRLITPAAARALHDAANEPKTIRWYEGDHIGTDEERVFLVLSDTIAWLTELDRSVREGLSE